MKKLLFIVTLVLIGFGVQAQYEFTADKKVACSSVKSQDNTGTCWSFSTVSFLESEVRRITGKSIDLSEMSIVHTIYLDKAQNYVLRQGKAQFGEGGLSHDVMNAIRLNGITPESVFTGNKDQNGRFNHSQLVENLGKILNAFIHEKELDANWRKTIRSAVNEGVGLLPGKFTYEGKGYTPKSFSKYLQINPDDYVTFTSFAHHPFYSKFILEIPDNYSNGMYYNIPISDLYSVATNALENGFTVAWDADVSEKGFNARLGLAVLPLNDDYQAAFAGPVPQKEINQKVRQRAFESYATTDDHLMHITGMSTDQAGHPYFVVKNSWGEIGPYNGIVYASKAYFDYKTIAIMVHKDAIPKAIKERFGL